MPWPVLGAGAQQDRAAELPAACRRAVILRECIGSTRGVVGAGDEQDAGILGAVLDVVVGRVGVQRLELRLVLHACRTR